MHIRSKKQLNELIAHKAVSPGLAEQLKAAIDVKSSNVRAAKHKRPQAAPAVPSESQGEASLRLALTEAFGLWSSGGEVVPELIPFQDRAYRVDFALPRWRSTAK